MTYAELFRFLVDYYFINNQANLLRPVVTTDRIVFVCYFDFFTREFDILYLCVNSTYLCTNSTCYVNFYAKNSRTNNAKITRFHWSRKSRNTCPISSGATQNETSFFSFSILHSSPAEGLKKLRVKCLLPRFNQNLLRYGDLAPITFICRYVERYAYGTQTVDMRAHEKKI